MSNEINTKLKCLKIGRPYGAYPILYQHFKQRTNNFISNINHTVKPTGLTKGFNYGQQFF